MSGGASPPPVWFDIALGRVRRLVSHPDAALSERLRRAVDRFARMNGATSLEGALTASVATPFVVLLDALRADYGLSADDPRIEALGEATLAGYFHVRLQDDLVDEPDQLDRGYLYVAEIFSGASQRAFCQALGSDPRFFAFKEQTMSTFAGTAIWEIDDFRAGQADENLVRLGQKFLPLAVPMGGMALLAGYPDHLDPLQRFVTCLGTGLQLVNDVLNVREDHAAGRTTPVLRWLYEAGRVTTAEPADNMRMALLADDSLWRALASAEEAMSTAEQLARSIGVLTVAELAGERARYLSCVPDRLLGSCLGVTDL